MSPSEPPPTRAHADYEESYFRHVSAYSVWGGYEGQRRINQLSFQARVVLGGEDLLDGRGKRALDVGAAYGFGCEVLNRMQYQATGLDVSRHAMKRASELAATFAPRFVVGDAGGGIPFRGAFDLITCFDVLEHLESPERSVQQMEGALKPGGSMVLSVPTKDSLTPMQVHDPTHINTMHAARLGAMLRAAHLEIVKLRTYHILPAVHRFVPLVTWVPVPEAIAQMTLARGRKPLARGDGSR